VYIFRPPHMYYTLRPDHRIQCITQTIWQGVAREIFTAVYQQQVYNKAESTEYCNSSKLRVLKLLDSREDN